MSNVIGILETAGATGRVAIDVSGAGDGAALAMLLDVRPVFACMVVAPDNEPEPFDPARQPAEDEPQEPDADAA